MSLLGFLALYLGFFFWLLSMGKVRVEITVKDDTNKEIQKSSENQKRKKTPSKTLLILPILIMLGGCCAKTPAAVVIRNGQIISLRECEIYSECPLDEVSLRQIAMNNELLK